MQREDDGPGSGFLITCDKNKQKQAIKDAFNFINEYIEEIYGDMESKIIEKELAKQGKEHNLQNEMEVRSGLKNKIRLLSSVDTGVNCLVFIKINEKICQTRIDPYAIVNAMMKDVHTGDRQLTRFCHKIMPVQRSFKAEHFRMLDQIDSMFQSRDNSEMKSWALNFKCRNNSKFNYKEVLGKTEQIAKKYGHFVDIYYPQWTVAVEIVHHLMCLSIVEGYKQYDQFRLHKKGAKPKPEGVGKEEQSEKNAAIRQKRQDKAKQKQIKVKKEIKIEPQESIVQKGEQQNRVKQQINQQGQVIKIEAGQKQKQSVKLLQQKIEVNNEDDIDFI